ncbi:YAP1-binding protein 2 [Cytospora mali]|uniref:YAP1-binding protein 2 n=1 Tax=Cytospora mali TaxID=578113 RepID=A0A194VK34_CYTMA|nr:YAP1-binding protein 2 [Valsa mali]
MADTSKAIEALKESRPPATDRFTYLTMIEQFLSPEILPALDDILQDATLTSEIGWDLVDMLMPLQGSEPCLETVARLGNPRECIIKVLEVLEGLHVPGAETGPGDLETETGEEEQSNQKSVPVEEANRRFITLLGMLAILHKRIKTKHPSRFLATSLLAVYKMYQPNEEQTASVLNLVHSLSGQRARPPLPQRKSSVNVANPDQDGDASKNAPDPEAEQETDVSEEEEVQRRLLLSFTSCVLESYVNANDMAWSRRLLEFYNPDKIVPGRKTATQAFREDQQLLNRDAMVGKLVALTRDLGLDTCSISLIHDICNQPVNRQPLTNTEDVSSADDIGLSTGGTVCLLAYWVFSSTVFDADQPQPDMHIFPDHHTLLENFLGEQAQSQILQGPATVEAILVLGLWLEENKRISAEDHPNVMSYHHALTLCSVFHPSIHVRNAAVTLAGLVLHDDPDDADRLKILEDLLENAPFASLKACALTWLREELIAAAAHKDKGTNIFATQQCIEELQYSIFPNLVESLEKEGPEALLEYWTENSAFLIQAANFAYFLFASDACKGVVPDAMGAAVEQRYVEPLLAAAERLEERIKKDGDEEGAQGVLLELDILQSRLKELPLH